MSDNDTVTLMAVGDVMLGDHSICIGHGVGSLIKKKRSEFIFENVSDILKKADITFGNLESVLSDIEIDPANIRSVQLRGSESSVDGLVSAGFDVMSVANNHCLEHGERSLIRTQELLSDSNIKTVGVSENKMRSRDLVILDRNGISFGFLAYCLVRDETAYCSVEDPHDIVSDIKKVKDDVDILIVSLHWGNEFVRKPSPDEFSLAHDIIDAGADLILGHHPHVLQGVESYNKGVIVYSMGNFVFDMWQRKMRESMIFSCKFSKNGIADLEIIPIYINEHYQPTPLYGKDKDVLLSKINNEFLERVGDDTYQKEVRNCRRQYRLALVKHLITNFYRYRPMYLYQILGNFIKK
ncbi:poly-gamma-glutamate synthesis protein (capsule biosynthesis protein) [Methanococcoides vulcani]|uniref:Poly-gamma-glutamate synthesis protein (Capsule biosynthesis protein) n=2 Tax=Methanococcoides vulcani TaxID=1353158 RepID=A0A1H9Z760_9EURY|nr:poly-gamma-glutamate synthesis protein (capsule biosynthesis protein) [Methanococcoides vulcani]